ncbi:hypothetical protein EV127DRAFT_445366 [Xylaria flabelliformis]|nr:hypothetical protein EV127DRAFT_445366 [Xylaria flabelliformis]
MRNFQAIFKSLLLAATIAGTAAALPANQTGTDGPDINAGWTLETFSDGSCRINIYNATMERMETATLCYSRASTSLLLDGFDSWPRITQTWDKLGRWSVCWYFMLRTE